MTETWLSVGEAPLFVNSYLRIAAILIPCGCQAKEEEEPLSLGATISVSSYCLHPRALVLD